LPIDSGFAKGQVADLEKAAGTVMDLVSSTAFKKTGPLAWHSATVFVPTMSSPLERKIIKNTWQRAGFQKVNLVSYATALRSFAERQTMRAGVGLYLGDDLSEAVLFTTKDQVTLSFAYQKSAVAQIMQNFLHREVSLQISQETVDKLYQALGQNPDLKAMVVRGKNIQDQQVVSVSLTDKQLALIAKLLRQSLSRAWLQLTSHQLFVNENIDQCLVVGDAFAYHFVQEQAAAQTLFLHSELELIQGVQWL
jgi:actin-like ATPase involved in cell morphogenesis